MAAKYKNIYLVRGTIKLTVVVQGAAQAFGKMVLGFTPNPKSTYFTYLPGGGSSKRITTLSPVNYFIVPHIEVDPSKDATYHLELPMLSTTGWYSNSVQHQGSYDFGYFITNPIGSGNGAEPTCNVCLYMSLQDVEFSGITTLVSGPYKDEEKTKVSSVLKNVSTASTLAAPFFPPFAAGLALFSSVTSVAGDVLKFFGFSKKPVVEYTPIMFTRVNENYTQQDGPSSAIVMGASQTQSIGLDPGLIGADYNQMSFDYILSRWGLISYGYTSFTSYAAEAFYAQWPVSPMIVRNLTAPIYSTPMSGLGLCFTFWRGDITYKFQFVASVFHRCTILICWDPMADDNATAPAFADALTTLRNVVVNVCGNTDVEFTVPYNQAYPMKLLGGELAAGDNAGQGANKLNGVIYMYVVNPMTSSVGTSPDSFSLNVFAKSDNMIYSVPKMNTTFAPMSTTTLVSGPLMMGTSTPSGKVIDLCATDSPRSVKLLANRFSLKYSSVSSGTGNYSQTLIIAQNPGMSDLALGRMTVVQYLASAYAGFRGGLKYSANFGVSGTATVDTYHSSAANKGLDTTPSAEIAYTAGAAQLDETILTGNYYNVFNNSISPRDDVISPQALPILFYPTRLVAYNNFEYVAFTANQQGSQFFYDIMQAAADDSVFIWFLGFPPHS